MQVCGTIPYGITSAIRAATSTDWTGEWKCTGPAGDPLPQKGRWCLSDTDHLTDLPREISKAELYYLK